MIQISATEQHYLQKRKPFEGLVWRMNDDGSVCCLVKVPHQKELDKFSLLFDCWEISSSSTSVILYYGVSSNYYNIVKNNLFYVFDTSSVEDKQILYKLAQNQPIYAYGYSDKGFKPLGQIQIKLQSRFHRGLETLSQKHLPPLKNQPPSYASKPQRQVALTKTQQAFVPLSTAELQHFPIIERCRYQLQKELHQLKGNATHITSPIFWRLLLIASLDQAKAFFFSVDAMDMIEQKRATLMHHTQPILSPEFHVPHLWFGFSQPIKTLVCPDTEAILLFSLHDRSLHQYSPLMNSVSEKERVALLENIYKRGHDFVSLNVINTQGKIVWSMSLPTTVEQARKHTAYSWLVPPWFQCTRGVCRSSKRSENALSNQQLCNNCKQAQLFFSSWLMTSWQALMGAYRDDDLDSFGSEQVMHFRMASSYMRDDRTVDQSNSLEYRYRIISYKDISTGLSYPWHPVLRPNGSWVEALMACDPGSLTWQERTVMPHYRILRSSRYKEPGTQISVRGHTRNTPMRTDRLDTPRETRVRAGKVDDNNEYD